MYKISKLYNIPAVIMLRRKLTQESRNETSRSAWWCFRQGGHGEAKWTHGKMQPPPPPAQRLCFRTPLLPVRTLWIVVHELKHCRLKSYSNQSVTSSCDSRGYPTFLMLWACVPQLCSLCDPCGPSEHATSSFPGSGVFVTEKLCQSNLLSVVCCAFNHLILSRQGILLSSRGE